ncbi:hypothetical protein MTO96_030290 [Rhipicephalus appendiculatus]
MQHMTPLFKYAVDFFNWMLKLLNRNSDHSAKHTYMWRRQEKKKLRPYGSREEQNSLAPTDSCFRRNR